MVKRSKSKSRSGSKRRSKSSRTNGKGGICMNALLNYGLIGAIIVGFLVIMVKVLTPVPKQVEGNSSKSIYFIKSDGCGHCQRMKDAWQEFSNSNPTNVKVKTLEAKNNADEIKELTKKFSIDVNGYPTILIIDEETKEVHNFDDESDSDYERDETTKSIKRSKNNFVKFCTKYDK